MWLTRHQLSLHMNNLLHRKQKLAAWDGHLKLYPEKTLSSREGQGLLYLIEKQVKQVAQRQTHCQLQEK